MPFSIVPVVDAVVDVDGNITNPTQATKLNKALIETHIQQGIQDATAKAESALDALEEVVAQAVAAALAKVAGAMVVRHYRNGVWEDRGDIPSSFVVVWSSETANPPTPAQRQPIDILAYEGA